MFSSLIKIAVLFYSVAVDSAAENRCWSCRCEEGPCIKNVGYSRDYQLDDDQITDKLDITALINGNPITDPDAVSLFLHDSSDNQWTEASFEVREEGEKSITLSIPLIGYDLLKETGCGKEGLKAQPFEKGRWGRSGQVELSRDQLLCYMVVVSVEARSVSAVYPGGCFKESGGVYPGNLILYPGKGILIDESPHKPWYLLPSTSWWNRKPQSKVPGGRNKRQSNPSELVITDFDKYPSNNGIKRKFVCKVQYQKYGAYVNLGLNVPPTDVTVYYRSSPSSSWGILLDLDHKNYNSNNGKNKYKSVVTKAHLNAQGVRWNGCFKCEAVQAGGTIVDRECHGGCSCN